ncbi:Ras GTPase-activating protein [Pelomyxa schiedti]|nr:Ras GTPase-activating protein [Pelomyxa schiedti]
MSGTSQTTSTSSTSSSHRHHRHSGKGTTSTSRKSSSADVDSPPASHQTSPRGKTSPASVAEMARQLLQGDINPLDLVKLAQSLSGNNGEEIDFVEAITQLKGNLLTEIRKARELEIDLQLLDKRIALLITNFNQATAYTLKKERKRRPEPTAKRLTLSPQKLQGYSHLFYLLQTEPSYLARLLDNLEEPDEVKPVLETIILTLYGDAFAPREESLLLQFFDAAICKIMSQAKRVMDFVKTGFLPEMVLTYNKRKQGIEYLQATLGPIIKQFLNEPFSVDISARAIYETMVTEQEIGGGRPINVNITDEECLAMPEVVAELKKNTENLKKISLMLYEAIINSINNLPYGLRWICKKIHDAAIEAFPTAPADDINRLTVHFVYFRFVNLGIVTPETFKITDNPVKPSAVFSLLQISKVIYNLLNITPFNSTTEKWLAALNPWLATYAPTSRNYLQQVLLVDNPQQHLEVDQYNELIQLVKPTILVKPSELSNMHMLLQDNLQTVILKPDDPLIELLNDLGPSETYDDDTHDISLVLANKFLPADTGRVDTQQLYLSTKSKILKIFRQTHPSATCEATLKGILTEAFQSGNPALQVQITEIYKNLDALETLGKVNKGDGFQELLKAIATDASNWERMRDKEAKELSRLRTSIDRVVAQQKYMAEQIDRYRQYVESCLANYYTQQSGRSTTTLLGPFKYNYLALVKKGVIVDSEIPKTEHKSTKIFITSPEPGIFEVEVRLPEASDKLEVHIADLLDKKDKRIDKYEYNHVTLDVNLTLSLFNSLCTRRR